MAIDAFSSDSFLLSERPPLRAFFFTKDLYSREDVIKRVGYAALVALNWGVVAGIWYLNHYQFNKNPLIDVGTYTMVGVLAELTGYQALSAEGRRKVINVLNSWLEEISLGVGELHYLPFAAGKDYNMIWISLLVGSMFARTFYTTIGRRKIFETGDDLLYPVRPGTKRETPLPMLEGPSNLICISSWKGVQLAAGGASIALGTVYDIKSLQHVGALILGYSLSPLGLPIKKLNDYLQNRALENGTDVGIWGGMLQRIISLSWAIRYPTSAVLLGLNYIGTWSVAGLVLGLIHDTEQRSFQGLETRRKITVPETFPKPGGCTSYFTSLCRVSTLVTNLFKTAAFAYMLAFIGYLMYRNQNEPESLAGLAAFTLGLPIAWLGSYVVFTSFNRKSYKKNNPLLNQAYFNLIVFPAFIAIGYEILRQMNQIDGENLNKTGSILKKIEIIVGFLLFAIACATNRFRQYAISEQKELEFSPMPSIAVFELSIVYSELLRNGIIASLDNSH